MWRREGEKEREMGREIRRGKTKQEAKQTKPKQNKQTNKQKAKHNNNAFWNLWGKNKQNNQNKRNNTDNIKPVLVRTASPVYTACATLNSTSGSWHNAAIKTLRTSETLRLFGQKGGHTRSKVPENDRGQYATTDDTLRSNWWQSYKNCWQSTQKIAPLSSRVVASRAIMKPLLLVNC